MKLSDTKVGKTIQDQYGGNHRGTDKTFENETTRPPTPQEYADAYKEKYERTGHPALPGSIQKIERYDRMPKATFVNRVMGDFQKITTEDIFPNKKIVLFGLPGAFTPTCSTKQLPAYDEAYDRFKGLGIDEVYCVSVNDGFVMNAWGDSLGIKNVKLLADGNGDFTQSLGVSVNKRHLGFGPRSWRYSIYVINSIVDQAFVEPGFNQTGEDDDPYTCSDPETIINYIQTTLR
tara:strand:- start:1187 stop:1885 length:699 start_codon:yes stop_codon:yes gene_type:complete